jgi:hypothetical protein
MRVALHLPITVSDTGLVISPAYGRIDDSSINLSQTSTIITLNWFASQTTAQQGLKPCRSDRVQVPIAIITADNAQFVIDLAAAVQAGTVHSPLDALKTALYLLVKQQISYVGAIDA